MRFNPEFQNEQTASLKSMPPVKKDEITSFGITFIITSVTNGYLAAVKNNGGKYKIGKGASKSMAIGDCFLNNQDDPE